MEELIKLAAEALGEDRWWEFADRLEADVYRSGGQSAYQDILDALSVAIEKETGHRFSGKRLGELAATSRAWPIDERDPDVEFEVHRALRGPSSKGKLAMYKRRAEDDYKRAPGYQGSPRLTKHRLQVYRKDEQEVKPWDVQVAASAKRLVNKAETLEALDELDRIVAFAIKTRRDELGG